MKKTCLFLAFCLIVLVVSACAKTQTETYVTEEIEGNVHAYSRLSDGTWFCEGQSYRYRLEISGTLPNATRGITFVYLSNLKEISFEQAWKAAGLSSFTGDYFRPEEAILVEWRAD